MPIAGAVLDHVAVAVESWQQAWPRYVHDLGGTWHSGGFNIGFAPHQLAFANEARLEVLQPWDSAANPFLRRFLDANGPGPHHLTFKVPDIAAALGTVEEAGFHPVSVDLSDAQWQEAFLHPREATGVVVQLAQAAGSWISPPPEGFPAPGPEPQASLTHVTHAVLRLDDGLAIFRDMLGGTERRRHTAPDGSWEAVTLEWSTPLAVRLVAPGAGDAGRSLRRALGERPGRVHHLAFRRPRPAQRGNVTTLPGVASAESPVEVIEPDDNFGTRLALS